MKLTESGTQVENRTEIAARFGKSVEWADLHAGDHRCLDRRRYILSCLVSDPACDRVARSYIKLNSGQRAAR